MHRLLQPVCACTKWENSVKQWKSKLQLSHSMTKLTEWPVHPAKTQISLGIRSVWSEPLLSAWRNLGSLATHWAHSEDWSDWRMPRRTETSLGAQVIWLVLSCTGSLTLGATGENTTRLASIPAFLAVCITLGSPTAGNRSNHSTLLGTLLRISSHISRVLGSIL